MVADEFVRVLPVMYRLRPYNEQNVLFGTVAGHITLVLHDEFCLELLAEVDAFFSRGLGE